MQFIKFKKFFNARRSFCMSIGFIGIIAVSFIYSTGLASNPIRSDGLGYYMYLPAFFIYKDISLSEKAEEFDGGKFPIEYGIKHIESTDSHLIKYPCGIALLMLPFFLLSHAFSLVFQLEITGFEIQYQIGAISSGLFYFIIGLSFLWKFLANYFRVEIILISLIAIVFGSNLFHYGTYDLIFSHIYSFFLFSLFLYLVNRQYYRHLSDKWDIFIGLVIGLIIVTRPTNILWLILGILYGVSSSDSFRIRMELYISQWKKALWILISAASIISIQMLYWKEVTGHVIYYSYQHEGFDFLNPQVVNVLFSPHKGLFFWSPILFIGTFGLMFSRSMQPSIWLASILFLVANIYVIASWETWWYGGSFGHRAFIESTPLFAFGLCFVFDNLFRHRHGMLVLIPVTFCVFWTSWHMIAYWLHIIPFDHATLSDVAISLDYFISCMGLIQLILI